MRYRYIAVLLAMASSACSQSEGSKATVDHNNQPIQPDQVVTLASNAFGCKSKFDLMAAAEQYQKHAFAAWARTTSADNGCFNGPPDSLKWTVYEMDYPAVSVGFASVAQYEAAIGIFPGIDPRGIYWVPSGFVYASPEPPTVESSEMAVQLAIFSDQNSANMLRERLQKQGFTGYVENVESGNKTLWRVRVGPVASRDAAENLRTQIAQRTNIEGIIVTQD